LFISIKAQLAGWQNGFKIFPITMRKNIKTGSQARKKRVVAVNKNMLFRYRRRRAYRIYNSHVNKADTDLN